MNDLERENQEIEHFILKHKLLLEELIDEIHNIRVSKKDTLKILSKKINIPLEDLDKFEVSSINDIDPKVFFALVKHYNKEIEAFIELSEQVMKGLNPKAAPIDVFKLLQ